MRANQGFWGGSKFEESFPQRRVSKLSQNDELGNVGLFEFEDDVLELKKRETVLDYLDEEYVALMNDDEDDDWDDEDWDDEDDDWDDEDDDWDEDDDEYWDDEDEDWDDEDEE